MSRKSFIQAQGATCKNWTWSWSFVNHANTTVIFGAWDRNTEGTRALILGEAWERNSSGKRKPAYSQSREHIKLIEEKGYKLLTFPIVFSDELQDENGIGPAKISGFEPNLVKKKLIRSGGNWYASDNSMPPTSAEEVDNPNGFIEGATKTISINAYERSKKARSACIKHYGAICAGCGFDFGKKYGEIGKGFIHVHHKVPLSEIRKEYKLDPLADLIPVCANCHAVVHLTQPAMTIEELRKCIALTEIA
jgi:5-methylcytosine-specific restriction protein A